MAYRVESYRIGRHETWEQTWSTLSQYRTLLRGRIGGCDISVPGVGGRKPGYRLGLDPVLRAAQSLGSVVAAYASSVPHIA
eukprot:2752820-Rhodomonas_salina.2